MKKVFALVLIVAAIGYLWYTRESKPVNPDSQTREIVQIDPGASLSAIANVLKERGLIRSTFVFKVKAYLEGAQKKLQAGSFAFMPSMTIEEIFGALTGGKTEEIIITIPEGFTVKDIDALLAEKGLSDAGAVIECANACAFEEFSFLPKGSDLAERGGRVEGYLYPDTYFVAAGAFTAEAFLERLLSTFEQRVLRTLKDNFAQSKRSIHEIVTMGSLIEEETRTSAERPVVSGILWKRYDAQMGLGVDATVRYILEKPTGTLTIKDLNDASPYNLRKFRGLPPGPIANAGIASIKASLHPVESPYWYYLHGNDGMIRYAVTNEEHNANKARYLR